MEVVMGASSENQPLTLHPLQPAISWALLLSGARGAAQLSQFH